MLYTIVSCLVWVQICLFNPSNTTPRIVLSMYCLAAGQKTFLNQINSHLNGGVNICLGKEIISPFSHHCFITLCKLTVTNLFYIANIQERLSWAQTFRDCIVINTSSVAKLLWCEAEEAAAYSFYQPFISQPMVSIYAFKQLSLALAFSLFVSNFFSYPLVASKLASFNRLISKGSSHEYQQKNVIVQSFTACNYCTQNFQTTFWLRHQIVVVYTVKCFAYNQYFASAHMFLFRRGVTNMHDSLLIKFLDCFYF